MKTFLFTTEFKDAKYGSKVTLNVYQVKNNTPVFIGRTNYNTGSFRGHNHEAMAVIVENKYLPKNCMTKSGYINYTKSEKVFKLIEL